MKHITDGDSNSRISGAPNPLGRQAFSSAVVSVPNYEEDPVSPAVEYYRTIVRHRAAILWLMGVGFVLSVALHLTTQPVFETRTSLDIHSLNAEFMNMRSLDPTVAASSGESNIQTEIKLLQSDSLMEQVRMRLTLEPHPAGVKRGDLFSRLQYLLHLGNPGDISFNDLLDETMKGVKVKPLGITRLVEITCDSWDAAFAARFCNVLTSEFQTEDLESRGSEAKHTSDWLMHQAADIREKAEESQQKLIAATGGNGLILSQESNTVGEDRLRQMQGELVKAQADRMEKQAQASLTSNGNSDTIPGLTNSSAYTAQKNKLAELENQLSTLVPALTEANPKVIRLRAEIAQVQISLTDERKTATSRLQGEFTAAKHREDLLTLAYRAQESSVSSDMQKGTQVALLRREVESEQQLYQTLLQRAKEAGFAAATQASTIRTVDAARTPRMPIYPRRGTAGVVGIFLGAFLGLLYAFIRDRSSTRMRMPGDSERWLHLSEIGVIPSNALMRSASQAKTASLNLPRLPASPSETRTEQTASWSDGFSLVAEAYRSATLSLLFTGNSHQAKAYLVSSPNAGEGKTTVTINLGIALTKAKLRVLLIDGDLRRPSLHEVLGVDNHFGLRNLLRGDLDFDATPIDVICKSTAFPRLSVVPAGTGSEDAVEMMHSPLLPVLLKRLTSEFDVVLLDSPPMLHMADARILAQQVDGTILIFRAGITSRDEAENVRDLLDRDRSTIIGTILNDFNPRREGKYGYYSSYYAYQQDGESKAKLAVRS